MKSRDVLQVVLIALQIRPGLFTRVIQFYVWTLESIVRQQCIAPWSVRSHYLSAWNFIQSFWDVTSKYLAFLPTTQGQFDSNNSWRSRLYVTCADAR